MAQETQSLAGSEALSSLTASTGDSRSSTYAVSNALDYAELFVDVDWQEVNLIELETEWRAELDQIEKDNVQALMDSTSKAQMVLPAVFKAIEEISKLAVIYEDYTENLKTTGMEINQIEMLNKGLETQTHNQEALLNEVKQIISLVAIPDGVLETLQSLSLDAPNSISKVERAATELYNLLNIKFEGGIQDIKAISDRLKFYNEQHEAFARRLVQFITSKLSEIINKSSSTSRPSLTIGSSRSLSLPNHDELQAFLFAYKPLILLTKNQCPREHLEICSHYQNSLGTLLSKDFSRFFETLKTSHLLKRPDTEHLSIFVNPAIKASSFGLNVGRSYAPSNKNFTTMRLLRPEDVPFLGEQEFVYPDQAMQFIILVIAAHMDRQRKLCGEACFGIDVSGPGGQEFKMSKKITAIQGGVYASLGERIPAFIDQCIKLDESSAIDLLAALDYRVPQCNETIPMLGKILEAVEQKVMSYAEFFLESQIEAIRATKYSAKKRSGVFSYVETFPQFVDRIESILSACGVAQVQCQSRALIDRYYDKIGQCIFDSFKQLAGEVDPSDEKGHINASVMTIENSHHLFQVFSKMERKPQLEPILASSRMFYENSLTTYASLSIYRVLGRFAEYFEGLTNLLKTTAAEEIAFTSAYSKASLKKMLASQPFKEIRKAIDLLHQRVLKHFADQPALIDIVWVAVQNDFIDRQRAIIDGLRKIFPGATDVSSPFGIDDIMAYFGEVSKRKY